MNVYHKVLFVGNSLVHGMGGYGMCASSPRNDFVYYVSEAIRAVSPDCVFSKLHGAPLEQAESREAAEAWWENALPSFESDLDLIVFQVADNVNNDLRKENFNAVLDEMVGRILKLCPKAKFLYVYGWYAWHVTHEPIERVIAAYSLPSVNLRDLNVKENQGHPGQLYETPEGLKEVHDNWITHPGNRGMKLIAERIIAAI